MKYIKRIIYFPAIAFWFLLDSLDDAWKTYENWRNEEKL